MKEINFVEIVRELNTELYDRFGETGFGFNYFEFHTTGFSDIITIAGIDVWNSENENREWDEETQDYEPFIPFIKKEFNIKADMLNSLKFDK